MRKIQLFILFISLLSNLQAQDKKAAYLIAGDLSVTANVQGPGIGLAFKREKPISDNFRWSLSAGILYFGGSYSYYDFSAGTNTTNSGFAIVPLLAGLKFYPARHFYLSGEAGIALAASSKTETHATFVPSAGYVLPLKDHPLDLSIRYSYIGGASAIPEKNWLQRGGYDIWSLRVAFTL